MIRLVITASALGLMLLAGGCGQSTGSAPRGADLTTTQRAHFDPPKSFSPTGVPFAEAVDIDSTIVVNGTAYVASGGAVRVFDTSSGQLTNTIRPDQPSLHMEPTDGALGGTMPTGPKPFAVELSGHMFVLAAFPVRVVGQGTTADRHVVSFDAIDATTSEIAWSVQLDLPEWTHESAYTAGLTVASVVGVGGTTAVVSAVAGDDKSVTYAIDLGAHTLKWMNEKFAAQAVAGETVVGETPTELVKTRFGGLGLQDGQPTWTHAPVYEASAMSAGPHLTLLSGRDYGSGHPFAWLVDARTGKTTKDLGDGSLIGAGCAYDERDVIVCSSDKLYGLDARTGAESWSLPSGDRVRPTVTAVWHGALYGSTPNGAVVLDARTGKDLNPSAGVSPEVVDSFVGLARDPSTKRVNSYFATS